jgi:hypothetical protein
MSEIVGVGICSFGMEKQNSVDELRSELKLICESFTESTSSDGTSINFLIIFIICLQRIYV